MASIASADSAVSDLGNDEEESYSESDIEEEESSNNILWTGYGKKTPVVQFRIESLTDKHPDTRITGEKYHLAYKMVRTESRLIRNILHSHGFHEVHPNSSDFNLMWIGGHIKPYTLRTFLEFQKVNHFPRSYELTRKDRIWKNIQRMQHIKGFKNFDITPLSFITPNEFQEFCTHFMKEKGTWIVKPIASSRGRGIFICNHPDLIPLDDTMIVSKYISNPLLVDGFKFDIRLYVAVTSYDPLVIYLYEEGLVRFATQRYDKSTKTIRNQYMHLTNYSVNKKSDNFVQNDDPDIEDYGNKWSLGALLRHLKAEGRDTAALMMRMEDVIIKTVLSVEVPVASACKMFVPSRGNCFEVYGFDILVDDNLKPWILEVNLSPSLACDSPLDMKIKSNVMTDLFTLIGVVLHDPMTRKPTVQPWRVSDQINGGKSKKVRPESAGLPSKSNSSNLTRCSSASRLHNDKLNKNLSGLSGEEIRIVRRVREEFRRKGGFIRIFPTDDTWELYNTFHQYSTSYNQMLHQRLFGEMYQANTKASLNNKASSQSTTHKSVGYKTSLSLKIKTLQLYPQLELGSQAEALLMSAVKRLSRYERQLSLADRKRKRKSRSASVGAFPMGRQATSVKDRKNNTRHVRSSTMTSLTKKDTQVVPRQPLSFSSSPEPDVEPLQSMPSPAPRPDSDSSSVVSVSTPVAAVRRVPIPHKTTPATDENIQTQGDDTDNPLRSATSVVTTSVGSVMSNEQDSFRPPTPPRKKPKLNLVWELKNGATLSQVQARVAFSAYLSRVRQRLLNETKMQSDEDVSATNQQMDLVLRFLKRAAMNLQTNPMNSGFRVVVPSRRLALADRKRILAKQLGDFVHLYNKETDGLERIVKNDANIQSNVLDYQDAVNASNSIPSDGFSEFVELASELDLEEVLTTYTRIHKSASIFLSSKPASTEINCNVNHEKNRPSGNASSLYQGSSTPTNTTAMKGSQSLGNFSPHTVDNKMIDDDLRKEIGHLAIDVPPCSIYQSHSSSFGDVSVPFPKKQLSTLAASHLSSKNSDTRAIIYSTSAASHLHDESINQNVRNTVKYTFASNENDKYTSFTDRAKLKKSNNSLESPYIIEARRFFKDMEGSDRSEHSLNAGRSLISHTSTMPHASVHYNLHRRGSQAVGVVGSTISRPNSARSVSSFYQSPLSSANAMSVLRPRPMSNRFSPSHHSYQAAVSIYGTPQFFANQNLLKNRPSTARSHSNLKSSFTASLGTAKNNEISTSSINTKNTMKRSNTVTVGRPMSASVINHSIVSKQPILDNSSLPSGGFSGRSNYKGNSHIMRPRTAERVRSWSSNAYSPATNLHQRMQTKSSVTSQINSNMSGQVGGVVGTLHYRNRVQLGSANRRIKSAANDLMKGSPPMPKHFQHMHRQLAESQALLDESRARHEKFISAQGDINVNDDSRIKTAVGNTFQSSDKNNLSSNSEGNLYAAPGFAPRPPTHPPSERRNKIDSSNY